MLTNNKKDSISKIILQLQQPRGINKTVNEILKEISGYILKYRNSLTGKNKKIFSRSTIIWFSTNKKFYKETSVDRIDIDIRTLLIDKSEGELKVNGSFIPERTYEYSIENNDYRYSIWIELNIEFDYRKDISKQLSNIFKKEVKKAIKQVMLLKRNSKEKFKKEIRKYSKLSIFNLLKTYPTIKEFVDCVYFSSQVKIDKIINETYNIIRVNKEIDNYKLLDRLFNKKLWSVIFSLKNYKVDRISRLSIDIKKELIKKLSDDILIIQIESLNTNDDINNFFREMEDKFNQVGYKLFRDIIRIIGEERYLENDFSAIVYMDREKVNEIFD